MYAEKMSPLLTLADAFSNRDHQRASCSQCKITHFENSWSPYVRDAQTIRLHITNQCCMQSGSYLDIVIHPRNY